MSKKLSILLILVWMLVIFNFSSKNTKDSNNTSTKLLYNISFNMISLSNKLNITNLDCNIKAHELSNKLNKPVRKVAHFSIYFILSIMCLYVFRLYKVNNYYLYSFLLCFIYSVTDEIHQLFISGRTGSIVDVIIDCLGCIMGLLFFKYIIGGKYEKV